MSLTVQTDHRSDPELALRQAIRMFLAGERLDMTSLAGSMGVGRATIYRWLGSREELLGRVLVELSARSWERCEAAAADTVGLDGLLLVVRRFLAAGSELPPLRHLVQQEPHFALHVLLDTHGALAVWIRDRVWRAAQEFLDPDERVKRGSVDAAVTVGLSLQWPSVIIGADPDYDAVIDVLRVLLTASP